MDLTNIKKLKVVVGTTKRKISFILVSLFYTSLYLFSLRDISLTQSSEYNIVIASDKTIFLKRNSGLQFEPVAQITISKLSILISPLNIIIALVISLLVASNIILIYLRLREPKSCDISEGGGIIASILALISGTACCGPIILLIIGVQATGAIISFFQFLVPISILLLVISLLVLLRNY